MTTTSPVGAALVISQNSGAISAPPTAAASGTTQFLVTSSRIVVTA